MTLENILLVIAGTLTAMLTGQFLAFSFSINGGLHRLKDAEYVRAMISINRVILNPGFFLTLMGPVFLLPLVTILYGGGVGSTRFMLLLLASILYIFGTFGITMSRNVPLNEKLDKFPVDSASAEEIKAARDHFEMPWNRLHNLRTAIGIMATVLVFAACLAKA